ncbi:C-type lectin domain family 2 member B-like [Hemicordylus capensis]|uniref:C-type lectin domain family 2 member B-like n=1 Tax=Hemicordylus capensis TaxID=884348 RepID=UPI0023020503|nr:C-type lectin domain family 2 member B-like [Hemicordylus capensis]XP_053154037.1 C-type lectin domain family 2 member B-like [Hemicordylus capensis]XP_053154038.1 C-type lectin domain family 2 member B-like [Hemicordylus capensis]XP_053154039.1 C-type lectin domain family 2 member B-like [Hemicordylus capensis]XP_053154040.1 C-type lectin domain family 2 member B-like [Hemicordylus capensis]
MVTGSKGETLDGNEKVGADELVLIEQWVDFNLEENKEKGPQSNSRVQNSVTWILLVLFIIQIVGLITTIFVFTMAKPDIPAAISATPCCPHGWIMNQASCYHFSELEGAWEAGQHHCSSLGASLAVIGNLEKLNITVKNKVPFNHWVGLHREPDDGWKWPDGTLFKNLFEVEGDGRCAYLSNWAVNSTDCSAEKKWLCSQKVKTKEGSHSHCRAT